MAVPVRFIDPFRAGQARYLLQGQPTADILLESREACLVAALGPALGPVAFSAYPATSRALVERRESIECAVRVLARAQRRLHGHPAAEAAQAVQWAFPELTPRLLTGAIHRYLATRTWPSDPVVHRAELDALQEILLHGAIRRTHAFETIVDPTWAEAAVRAAAVKPPGPALIADAAPADRAVCPTIGAA